MLVDPLWFHFLSRRIDHPSCCSAIGYVSTAVSMRIRSMCIVVIVDEIRIPSRVRTYIARTGDKITFGSAISPWIYFDYRFSYRYISFASRSTFCRTFVVLSPRTIDLFNRTIDCKKNRRTWLSASRSVSRIFIRVTETRDTTVLWKAQKTLYTCKYVLYAAGVHALVCVRRGREGKSGAYGRMGGYAEDSGAPLCATPKAIYRCLATNKRIPQRGLLP